MSGSTPRSLESSSVQVASSILSPQEAAVLRHIAEGFTYASTARCMGISVHTVDGYLRRIRAKSGLRAQADLFRFAMTHARFGGFPRHCQCSPTRPQPSP